MDWNALVQHGKAAYPKLKAGKKAFDYLKLVKGAIDENTRNGSLFKLGVKGTMDIASKVIGTSVYNGAGDKISSIELVALSTHDACGLTEKDLALAGEIGIMADQLIQVRAGNLQGHAAGIVQPGFHSLSYGVATPAVTLVAHVVYGAVLGLALHP